MPVSSPKSISAGSTQYWTPQVSRVSSRDGEITVEVIASGDPQSITSDTLLMATGRVPNTDILEVVNSRLEVGQRGYVHTDEYLQANVPGIWALGDIVGRYLLKHSANICRRR